MHGLQQANKQVINSSAAKDAPRPASSAGGVRSVIDKHLAQGDRQNRVVTSDNNGDKTRQDKTRYKSHCPEGSYGPQAPLEDATGRGGPSPWSGGGGGGGGDSCGDTPSGRRQVITRSQNRPRTGEGRQSCQVHGMCPAEATEPANYRASGPGAARRLCWGNSAAGNLFAVGVFLCRSVTGVAPCGDWEGGGGGGGLAQGRDRGFSAVFKCVGNTGRAVVGESDRRASSCAEFSTASSLD